MLFKTAAKRLRDDAAAVVISVISFAAAYGLMASKGHRFGMEIVHGNALVFALAATLMLAADFVAFLALTRPDRPLGALRRRFVSAEALGRLIGSLPLIAALIVFMPYFSAMKAMIPQFHPFDWDATFVQWDRSLLGTDAWKVLQPVLGFPLVTSALSITYQTWLLLVNLGCLVLCFYLPDRAVRRQFFTSYMACWALIGMVMATLLASVGPCFLGPLFGDNSFAGQMAYLNEANRHYPVTSLAIQNLLIERYRMGGLGLGSGISAMPSMHVSVAMLYWLAVRRVSRPLGRFFLAFLIVIFIGSIHLAYHYAVDGLVAMAVTLAIWLAAGKLLGRLSGEAATERAVAA